MAKKRFTLKLSRGQRKQVGNAAKGSELTVNVRANELAETELEKIAAGKSKKYSVDTTPPPK